MPRWTATIALAWFAATLSAGCTNRRLAQDGREWLRPAPPEAASGSQNRIADEFVFEVVASQLRAGLRHLEQQRSVLLTDQKAGFYTGPYLKCGEGRRPYLVRAVYGHLTGGYSVTQVGGAILVFHGSLGRSMVFNKSVLVVCLDFAPTDVFTQVHVGE